MTKKRFLWWSIPVLLLILAATALVYRDLPADHSRRTGTPPARSTATARAPRSSCSPLIALLVLLWPGLPSVSPDKFRVEASATPGGSAAWWWSACSPISRRAAGGAAARRLDIGRALFGGIGIAIVLLGNVLGKVKRNFWLGVRTPWTLASDRVWYATHRLAGKTMVAGGLAVLAARWPGCRRMSRPAALLAGALVPVVYSLVYYKRLERRRCKSGFPPRRRESSRPSPHF
jgi:hypothetical protein